MHEVKLDLTTAILQDTAQLKLPGMRSSHDSVVLLLYSESSEAIEGYLRRVPKPKGTHGVLNVLIVLMC